VHHLLRDVAKSRAAAAARNLILNRAVRDPRLGTNRDQTPHAMHQNPNLHSPFCFLQLELVEVKLIGPIIVLLLLHFCVRRAQKKDEATQSTCD
jgi:hypothetical protein